MGRYNRAPAACHLEAEARLMTDFDYTADEDMLPFNHFDPPQINDVDDGISYQEVERKLLEGGER